MKKESLEKFRKKLEEKKELIEKELSSFAVRDKENKENWKTRFPRVKGETGSSALEKAADEVEEYGSLLPIEHSLEKKLQETNLALKKIKKGTYGICEKCKKPIPLERLDAYPEARYCKKCQERTS